MSENRVPRTGIEPKGFFASLFDTTFTSFITPTVYSFSYVTSVILIVLAGIVAFVVSISQGKPLFVVITPIATFFVLVLTRMCVESVVLFFRIGENIQLMVNLEMADVDVDPISDGVR